MMQSATANKPRNPRVNFPESNATAATFTPVAITLQVHALMKVSL